MALTAQKSYKLAWNKKRTENYKKRQNYLQYFSNFALRSGSFDTVLADYNFTLLTNPYVNEVTLRRQKPPLKCC